MATFVTSSDLEFNFIFEDEDPPTVIAYFKRLIAERVPMGVLFADDTSETTWQGGVLINLAVVSDFSFSSTIPGKELLEHQDSKQTIALAIPDDLRSELDEDAGPGGE
ncbi:hypothetical protein GCM10009624_15140 [Gordonia sinesedis]